MPPQGVGGGLRVGVGVAEDDEELLPEPQCPVVVGCELANLGGDGVCGVEGGEGSGVGVGEFGGEFLRCGRRSADRDRRVRVLEGPGTRPRSLRPGSGGRGSRTVLGGEGAGEQFQVFAGAFVPTLFGEEIAVAADVNMAGPDDDVGGGAAAGEVVEGGEGSSTRGRRGRASGVVDRRS